MGQVWGRGGRQGARRATRGEGWPQGCGRAFAAPRDERGHLERRRRLQHLHECLAAQPLPPRPPRLFRPEPQLRIGRGRGVSDARRRRLRVGGRQQEGRGALRRPRGRPKVFVRAVRTDQCQRAQRHPRRCLPIAEQLERWRSAQAVREHMHGRQLELAAHCFQLRGTRADAAHGGWHVAASAGESDLDHPPVAHRERLEVLEVIVAQPRVAN